MKRNIFLIFLSVLFFSLFCGCGEKKKSTASKQERLTVPVSKLYPKIKEHQMNLNIISTRGDYYIAETNPTMRFQFINEGLSRIEIPEWKSRERENIRIQYAECPAQGDSERLKESAWKDSPRTVFPGDCPRYPLTLDPKNSIIMELPLRFIGKLEKPGRYAVRAVLDLTSLDVKSSPVELNIR
jgi:hypothetical protein